MRPDESAEALRVRLTAGGRNTNTVTAAEGLSLMLAFYEQVRFEACPLGSSGDMLLCQWGIYPWSEDGTFEFDLTRQFILDGDAEDDNIFQLSLTFRYPATPEIILLGVSNSGWCRTPEGLKEFETLVRTSPPYLAVATMPPSGVKIDYFCAG